MRFLVVLFLLFPQLGAADPGTMCSKGQYGHAFCVRPNHFVFDVCHAIAGEAAQYELDPDFFARLIWQESRFDPNARSPADAMGIAQFISATAQRRNLKDPFNPAEALEESARFLAHLTQEFGNVGLAAAAYNSGEERTAQFMARQRRLPRETVNYVRIITGLDAEVWRDTPPVAPSFRLDPQADFLPACFDMAKRRRVTSLAPPEPTFKKWGVQIAFGKSRSDARAAVTRKTRECRALVRGEKIDFHKVRNRVQGRPNYVMARIGRDTRAGGISLCQKLSRAGCTCRVYKN